MNLFLQSIGRIAVPNYELHYHFIDDNHNPHSQTILDTFRKSQKNVTVCKYLGESAHSPYRNHKWNDETIWKVANFKDAIIRRAREEIFDYLFLIDSDLLLHPETITHLVQTGKDIVSEVFWTKWSEGAIPQPQVWLSDFYNQYRLDPGEYISEDEKSVRTGEFFSMLREPGIYEVGGLGACTLISKAAIDKGASFQRIKNVTFWGEDRHFCIRASALGIDLFVDTHYPAYHIFRSTELPGGIDFLNRTEVQ